MLYIRDSDFITVEIKFEAQIMICSLTPYLLISFFIFMLVAWLVMIGIL